MIRVLINAYAVSPSWGSEQGMGWNWIINIAKYCEVYVITEGEWKKDIEKTLIEASEGKNNDITPDQASHIHFYYNPVNEKIRKMCWNQGDWRFYWYYKKWQQKTLDIAKHICSKNKIDIIHQLNMVGFREPGYLWKIKNIPFVWGPVGGMEKIPINYLNEDSYILRIKSLIKNLINKLQLKYSIRVQSAIKNSQIILAATKGSYLNLKNYNPKSIVLINETGCQINQCKHSYNINKQSFDIIWVGRFYYSKQLNVALRTMNELKNQPNIKLHIVGSGSLQDINKYHKLAEDLNLNNVFWYGNIEHNKVQAMMQKADLFFFTSIKDATSSVILEAISNGLPILCYDICGFGPIVDKSIGRKIQLSSPRKSITEFSQIIRNLESDRKLLEQMSLNCKIKQQELSWENRSLKIVNIYKQILSL